MGPSRRLAAIMFTDMVGYTASAQINEGGALDQLRQQGELVRPLVAYHQGREIKSTGDGFLVEFDSALKATQCAISIQRRIYERNAEGSLPPIRIRIGIHLGDVVLTGTDIFGDAVNIAARIEPLAEPGGICVSGAVQEQVRNKVPDKLEKLAPTALKGLQLPVDIYRVVLPWLRDERSAGGTGTPPSERNRIAVLPFVSISPDPNDEYFADGLTEEIIATISKIEGVEVISRTSVMQYKKNPVPVTEVAKGLGVTTVLEGSVRKAGNSLRITVQVIDASNDKHLWVERYDRELQDVFAIQSDIGSRVAEALQARFSGAGVEVPPPTRNLEAYTLFLRATQLYHQNDESSIRGAIATFERAIARDAGYASAYAGLSHAWAELRFSDVHGYGFVMEKAETAARRAVELDPSLAEAHYALAKVNGHLDRWNEAISEAERAIGINPNLSEGNVVLGWLHLCLGRVDQSLEFFRRSHELDPLNPQTSVWLSTVLCIIGRFEEAGSMLERLREFSPSSPDVYRGLVERYLLEGDFKKAEEALDYGLQVSPLDTRMAIYRGVIYALTGRRPEAEAALTEFVAKSKSLGLYAKIFVYAALGDLNKAFGALFSAAETHTWPILLKTSPFFGDLRKDQRFSQFCARVGLPPS